MRAGRDIKLCPQVTRRRPIYGTSEMAKSTELTVLAPPALAGAEVSDHLPFAAGSANESYSLWGVGGKRVLPPHSTGIITLIQGAEWTY